MEREPDSENRITKTGNFSQKTTKKLENSKEVNKNGKRSHEKVVWQEKAKLARIEEKRQYVARSQKYSFELTLNGTLSHVTCHGHKSHMLKWHDRTM